MGQRPQVSLLSLWSLLKMVEKDDFQQKKTLQILQAEGAGCPEVSITFVFMQNCTLDEHQRVLSKFPGQIITKFFFSPAYFFFNLSLTKLSSAMASIHDRILISASVIFFSALYPLFMCLVFPQQTPIVSYTFLMALLVFYHYLNQLPQAWMETLDNINFLPFLQAGSPADLAGFFT